MTNTDNKALAERLELAAVNVAKARRFGLTEHMAGWEAQAIREAAAVLREPSTPSANEGDLAWRDEALARHWIDRYDAGIDDDPQMGRILDCVAAPARGEKQAHMRRQMDAVWNYLKPNASNDMDWADEIIIAIDQRVQAATTSAQLWCLHIEGPDDIHPAPSKAHAEKAAEWFNKRYAGEQDVMMRAVVEPYPYSAESHAEGVDSFITDWLLPQCVTTPSAQADKARGEVWLRPAVKQGDFVARWVFCNPDEPDAVRFTTPQPQGDASAHCDGTGAA